MSQNRLHSSSPANQPCASYATILSRGALSRPVGAHAAPLRIESAYTLDGLGECVRRLFVVWNRAYNTLAIVAETLDEAIKIAMASKHIRRATNYRRVEDVTDAALAQLEGRDFGDPEYIRHVLEQGKSGIAYIGSDGAWTLAGEVILPV